MIHSPHAPARLGSSRTAVSPRGRCHQRLQVPRRTPRCGPGSLICGPTAQLPCDPAAVRARHQRRSQRRRLRPIHPSALRWEREPFAPDRRLLRRSRQSAAHGRVSPVPARLFPPLARADHQQVVPHVAVTRRAPHRCGPRTRTRMTAGTAASLLRSDVFRRPSARRPAGAVTYTSPRRHRDHFESPPPLRPCRADATETPLEHRVHQQLPGAAPNAPVRRHHDPIRSRAPSNRRTHPPQLDVRGRSGVQRSTPLPCEKMHLLRGR